MNIWSITRSLLFCGVSSLLIQLNVAAIEQDGSDASTVTPGFKPVIEPGSCSIEDKSLTDSIPDVAPYWDTNESLPLTTSIVNFIEQYALGNFLFPIESYECLLNMNMTTLATTIAKAGNSNPVCTPALDVLNIPWVTTVIQNVALPLEDPGKWHVAELLSFLRDLTSNDWSEFCTSYTSNVVTCFQQTLWPSFAILRSKNAQNCCNHWSEKVVNDYGFSISDHFTKFMQVAGDAMCASQTVSNEDNTDTTTQPCGYSIVQSLIPSSPSDTSLLEIILQLTQIPTSNVCKAAEGQTYTDIQGKESSPLVTSDILLSGCALPLQQVNAWLADMPAVSQLNLNEMFKGDNECIEGKEVSGILRPYFPESFADLGIALLEQTCIHLSLPSATNDTSLDCQYSASAELLKWKAVPRAGHGDSEKELSPNSSSQTIDSSDSSQTDSPSSSASKKWNHPCSVSLLAAITILVYTI